MRPFIIYIFKQIHLEKKLTGVTDMTGKLMNIGDIFWVDCLCDEHREQRLLNGRERLKNLL